MTSLWFSGLPIYFILFLAIATLVGLWMSNASLRVAGDAASIAVTKELDELMDQEIEQRMDYAFSLGIINTYDYVLGTEEKKRSLLKSVIYNQQDQLISAAKKYLKKNHAEEQGKLIFTSDGRVLVQAERKLNAYIFEDVLQAINASAFGRGPKRSYLEWLGDSPDDSIEIKFH